MPGAYPTAQPRAARPSGLSNDATLLADAFEAKSELCSKVEAQKLLISSLNSTTYFLIGFQFLRFTHSACMPPSLGHLFIQFLLQPWRATALAQPDLFGEHLDAQQEYFLAVLLPFNRATAAKMLLRRTCLLIYWKFVAVALYHILFYIFWLQPVALQGRLSSLEHGSWYGLLFIGEEIAISVLLSDMFLFQLLKLELVQVLMLDLAILLLQLVLYQCIFMQSTLSPNGVRLNEPEAFILRGEPGVPTSKLVSPDLIQIRLYESMQKEAYSLSIDLH